MRVIIQQAGGAVQVSAGVVARGGAAAATGDRAPRPEALLACHRPASDTDTAQVVAMDVAHTDRAIAHSGDRAIEGVVLLDRAGARLLPQPTEIHSRAAAAGAINALAVSVVAEGLGHAAIGDTGRAILGVPEHIGARAAAAHVAVLIVALAGGTGAHGSMRLAQCAVGAAYALGAVTIGAHAGLAGQVADRVVGVGLAAKAGGPTRHSVAVVVGEGLAAQRRGERGIGQAGE